jgi:cytochrome c2
LIQKGEFYLKSVTILGIVFIVYVLCLQTYGQKKEPKESFPYESWKYLYESKCSKCHPLDRIFADRKTEEEWRLCITRMIEKSPLWITQEEGEQIITEILGTKKDEIGSFPKKKKYADARMLFIDRCTICHSVNRILLANKTGKEWKEIVTRMRDNAPELFLEEDLPVIIEYLTERQTIIRDDVAAQKIVDKCLICHDANRIFIERKSRKEWKETVADMRLFAREKFKKDWFTHHESKIIVNLLVKTQGM